MQGQRSNEPDLELLRQAARGSATTFHTLIDRHADRLHRLAVSLLGNPADAQDVLQETLIGAYRSADTFMGRASVRTWLTRILVVQTARWRRNKAKRVTQHLDPACHALDSADHVAAVERSIDLQNALQQMPADHREVLVLREYEQLSYAEIAQVLKVPRGTVESRLFRARAALRTKLKDCR